MTIIDHLQAATDSVARILGPVAWGFYDDPDIDATGREEFVALSRQAAQKILTAAAPHLRAAWEEPIRELCEAQIERANGPLAPRGFNGQPFPARVSAVAILALLEGGGE